MFSKILKTAIHQQTALSWPVRIHPHTQKKRSKCEIYSASCVKVFFPSTYRCIFTQQINSFPTENHKSLILPQAINTTHHKCFLSHRGSLPGELTACPHCSGHHLNPPSSPSLLPHPTRNVLCIHDEEATLLFWPPSVTLPS